MKCSNCGKNNATISYQQNINGEVMNLQLCESCAHKLGIFNSLDDVFSPMILDFDYVLPEEIKCKKCGYTLSKYKSTGMFGCDECYNTFKKDIDSMLLRIQGKNRHVKEKELPKETTKETDKLTKLREELKGLIEQEKFEDAAVVRDKIKKLENKGKEK